MDNTQKPPSKPALDSRSRFGIQLEVWGDYALFSRGEFKVERITYDVMTPSAARGILEAIYYHPGLRWIIDRIYVLSENKYANFKLNELKSKASSAKARNIILGGNPDGLYINRKEDIQQRTALVLKDVHYVIEAHFEMTSKANPSDNPGKFHDIFVRRAEKGQCYHTPYFGCREFPVKFRLWESEDIPTVYNGSEKDLGYMLYDFDYSNLRNIQPMYFKAILKNGVLDVRNCEVLR